MINLAIIDADSICYMGSKEDSLQQILEKVDNKIQEILLETNADYYILLISKGKYFRHEISKSKEAPEGSYKANRSYLTQPWVKTIKEYLIAKYKAVWCPNLEADDVAAWLMNKKEFDVSNQPELWGTIHKILVAKDKDLLYSIPGRHLNFSKKLGPEEWGMEWVETTLNDAPFFIWYQMVANDNSDGIKGLYRKGKAWCDKNFEGLNINQIRDLVLDEYVKEFGQEKGIYQFALNYRLLHMLNSDEDMMREVGYIPTIPEFQKVNKLLEEEIKIDF